MLEIINEITTDWSQFWPGMIATFVGFVLALMGQFVWEKCTNYFEAKHLLSRIRVELQEISEVLGDITDGSIDMQPLKTLVWDEAINVGLISLLSDKKREVLFKLYKQIQEFNSWFGIKTKYYFSSGRHNEQLIREITCQKEILLGSRAAVGKISIKEALERLEK